MPASPVPAADDVGAPSRITERDRDSTVQVAVTTEVCVSSEDVVHLAVQLPRGPRSPRALLPRVPEPALDAAPEELQPVVVMP